MPKFQKSPILGQKRSKNGQKREKSIFLENRTKDFAEIFRINRAKWDNLDGIGGFWSKTQKSGFFGPKRSKNGSQNQKMRKKNFFDQKFFFVNFSN